MEISVDKDLCDAHGQCFMVDEELFPLDEEGFSTIGEGAVVPAGKEDVAREAADACPKQALLIQSQ